MIVTMKIRRRVAVCVIVVVWLCGCVVVWMCHLPLQEGVYS